MKTRRFLLILTVLLLCGAAAIWYFPYSLTVAELPLKTAKSVKVVAPAGSILLQPPTGAATPATESIATENPTPAAPQISSMWAIGDDERRKATRVSIKASMTKATNLKGAQLDKELDEITAALSELGKTLDTNPRRPSAMNVSPPLLRADGTRYSSQGVMSGMSPSAIIDPEQRQAYLDKMARNQENNRISSWLSEADGDYNGLMVEFDFILRQLQRIGSLDKEKAEAAIKKARRVGR